MKNSDFKKISSALTKTSRAFELSFGKLTIERLGVSYSDEEFKIDFDIYVEDLGIGRILIQHQDDDAENLIEDFADSLIEQIEHHLEAAREREAKFKGSWDSHRVYSHEFSYVSSVISLEMTREIILSIFKLKTES
jgi:hypothetical protein